MSKQSDLLQRLTRSETGIRAALWLGQRLPAKIGHSLSRLVADWLAPRRSSTLVQGMRVNQWVVHGGNLTADELNQVVKNALRVNIRSLFDFYHNLNRPHKILEQVRFTPKMLTRLETLKEYKHGALVVAAHNSNFDLAGRALNLHGLRFQALSYPQPPSGYALQNQLRLEGGMEVTPMSMQAYQMARQRLTQGGVVVTGIDRAIDRGRLRPVFFGRPSNLPVAYMQLALHAQTPVLLVNVATERVGYSLDLAAEFMPEAYSDRDEALLRNTERVLSFAEEIIRAKPQDWSQTYPAWDDVEAELPE